MRTIIVMVLTCFSLSVALADAQLTDEEIADLSLQVFSVQGDAKADIVKRLANTQDKSLIPTLVLAMRWTGANVHVAEALSTLTGTKIRTWHEAYEWQESHPEITPHKSYRPLKLRFLGNTDKRFLNFFSTEDGDPSPMSIRLEEIVWGGARYEGIPSLDLANTVSVTEADYLLDDDLVFGVEINGDARAYPLRILGWHEMANDVIGGVHVALAYCTLCGSGILYETARDGDADPLSFGSSGLLYRSNKLMFDRQTRSLWNQFTGRPVSGELVDSGIELKTRPITITTWQAWSQQHPHTRVLSLDTGFTRNYGSGVTYATYFASPDLMFPAVVKDESTLARKDYVFGVRQFAASKAWAMTAFDEEPVINDQVGATPVVIIGNSDTRTARAYEREPNEEFSAGTNGAVLLNGEVWLLEEDFLRGPGSNDRRARIPGHVSYWFAWENFMGTSSELYQAEQ